MFQSQMKKAPKGSSFVRKINSEDVLKSRAAEFESYLGTMGEYAEGKISFPSAEVDCALTLHSRRSIMSVNHYLSLQGFVPLQDQVDPELHSGKMETTLCYLGRFGGLRTRAKDPLGRRICETIRKDAGVIEQLRQTHLDSLQIRRQRNRLSVMTNLYGGGYSSTMLPPTQFTIGISRKQVQQSAVLFTSIMSLLASELKGS